MGKVDEAECEETRKLLERSVRKARDEAGNSKTARSLGGASQVQSPGVVGFGRCEHVTQALNQVTGMRNGSSAVFLRLAALRSFKLRNVLTGAKESAVV